MSLTRRGKFWHFRFKFKGREYSGSTKLTSHREAKAYEDRFRANLSLATVGLAQIPTMEAAWLSWSSQAKSRVSAKHLARAESCWRIHLEPSIGHLRASQVDEGVVAILRDRYLGGASSRVYGRQKRTAAGLATLLGYLRMLLRHVAEECPGFQVPRIRIPRSQEPVRAYVPQEKIREFFASIDRTSNLHQSLAARLCLFLGLRECECYALRFEWLRDRAHSIVIGRSKGKESATLVTNRETRVFLYALNFGVLPDLGLVMPAEDGKAHRNGFLRQAIARFGMPGLTVHRLRTSCATLMARAGVDARVIQAQLRHKDIKTTMRYIQVGKADLEAAQERAWGVQISHGQSEDIA